MSVTENPQQPAPAPQQPQTELSRWARLPADIRTLIVTTAGTVLGGVLLAMVVAVAVAATRWENRRGGTSVGIDLLLAIAPAGLVALSWFVAREMRRSRQRGAWLFFASAVAMGVLMVFAWLVLLGYAAGVK